MQRIDQVAHALGKSPQTIRVGLQLDKYPFGMAYRREDSSRYTYVLWPPLVRQYVGINIGPMAAEVIEEELEDERCN